MTKALSEFDRLEDIFAGKSTIGILSGLWDILISENCALFEELIHIKIATIKDKNKAALLRIEYLAAYQIGQRRLAERKNAQTLIDWMTDDMNHDIYTLKPTHVKDKVIGLKTSEQKYLLAIQNLADIYERGFDLKKTRTTTGNLKAITDRIDDIIMNGVGPVTVRDSDCVERRCNDPSITKDDLITEAFMKQFSEYQAILSIVYDDYESEKSKELIKQALDYTCSIDTDLAKRVIKVHGNLTHVLANGEQCQLCQP
jgi:hypothetical protein